MPWCYADGRTERLPWALPATAGSGARGVHCSHEFYQEFISFWGEDIGRAFPGVNIRFGKPLHELMTGVRYPGRRSNDQNLTSDLRLDCQFVINSPVQQVSSVEKIHVDLPEKLFAALLYFRDPSDGAGGDLELYRVRSDQQVEKFDVVQYQPNMLIMWLNTPLSFHGVTPRQTTEMPRRYINLLGESYTLPANGFHGYYRRAPTVSSYLTDNAMGYRGAPGQN